MPIENLEEYENYLKSKGIDPYKEVTRNDTDNSVAEKTKITDTNTPEQRIIRLTKQREIEPLIDKFNSQSIIERITYIREKVFSENDVRGDLPTRIRQRLVQSGKGENTYYYPNEIRMAEKYFPELVRFVDSLYEKLLETPNLQEEQALRFSAVLYDMGILVHPYVDGNGQTFRIAAESYLHELADTAKNKYFPYKIFENPDSKIRAVHNDLIDKAPLSADTAPFQGLIQAQEFIKTMPTYDMETNATEDFTVWLQNLKEFLNDRKITPETSIEVLKQKLREEAKKLKSIGIERDVIDRFLNSQQARNRQGVIHGYLDYILSDPKSLNMHLDYILTGELKVNDDTTPEMQTYTQMAFYTHNRTFSQMQSILQSTDEHNSDYESAIAALEKKKSSGS